MSIVAVASRALNEAETGVLECPSERRLLYMAASRGYVEAAGGVSDCNTLRHLAQLARIAAGKAALLSAPHLPAPAYIKPAARAATTLPSATLIRPPTASGHNLRLLPLSHPFPHNSTESVFRRPSEQRGGAGSYVIVAGSPAGKLPEKEQEQDQEQEEREQHRLQLAELLHRQGQLERLVKRLLLERAQNHNHNHNQAKSDSR